MDDLNNAQGGRNDRSLAAEQAVIGSLLIDPKPVAEIVFHMLRPDDFGNAAYRKIFTAGMEIWLEQGTVDVVLLQAALDEDYDQTLRDAMIATPSAASVELYAQIVIDGARIRRLRDIGLQLTLHPDEADQAMRLLSEADNLMGAKRSERVYSYREMLERYLDRQNDTKPLDYIDWGIEELNRNVKISQGRFVILGAPSSVGKTALALQLAYNIAKAGKRVGFFSYETSEADAGDRLFANTASVPMNRTKTKTLSGLDFDALMQEGDASGDLSFTLEDSGDWTVDELRARTIAMQYEVIFLDYVQIIPGDPKKPRWEVVTDISMKLHRMAQKLGVTVIALSQITSPEKDSKGKRRALTKEDLRESQQLSNDAEAVLLMDLTAQGDYNSERELRIDKNKDGSRGKIYLKFDPLHMRFTPCEKPQHLKRAEYHEEMARIRKEKKQQRQDDLTQMGFDELPGRGDDLPF